MGIIVAIISIVFTWHEIFSPFSDLQHLASPVCGQISFTFYVVFALYSVVLITINVILGKIGNWFSNFASPTFFSARNMVEIAAKKIGFRFGPTIVLCIIFNFFAFSFFIQFLKSHICI